MYKVRTVVVAVALCALVLVKPAFCDDQVYVHPITSMSGDNLNVTKNMVQKVAKKEKLKLEFGDAAMVAWSQEDSKAGNFIILSRVNDSKRGWVGLAFVCKDWKLMKTEWTEKGVPDPTTVPDALYFSDKEYWGSASDFKEKEPTTYNKYQPKKPDEISMIPVQNKAQTGEGTNDHVFTSGMVKGCVLITNKNLSGQPLLELANMQDRLQNTFMLEIERSLNCMFKLDDVFCFAKSPAEAAAGNYIFSTRVSYWKKDQYGSPINPAELRGLALIIEQGKYVGYLLSSNVLPDITNNPSYENGWYGEKQKDNEEAKQAGAHRIKGHGPVLNMHGYQDPLVAPGSSAMKQKCKEIFEEKHLTGVRIKSCEVFSDTVFNLKTNTCDILCIADSDQGSAYLKIRLKEGKLMPFGIEFGENK